MISAPTPAASPGWPMFVFSEPMAQNCVSSVPRRNAWVSAAISIGSPISVPVPWASTYVTSRASTPATASASVTTWAWPSTLGAR